MKTVDKLFIHRFFKGSHIPIRCAMGIVSNSLQLLDSSAYASDVITLVFSLPHYHLRFELHFVPGIISNPDDSELDSSTNEYYCATLVIFESH